jgi:hypothetical protein
VSGTHLVDENRVDSNAEVDRLVGCIFAKAALQQNATTQPSSVLALFIWRAQRLRSTISLVRDAAHRNRYNRQSFAHDPTLRGYARLENLASLQGRNYRRFNVCG